MSGSESELAEPSLVVHKSLKERWGYVMLDVSAERAMSCGTCTEVRGPSAGCEGDAAVIKLFGCVMF